MFKKSVSKIAAVASLVAASVSNALAVPVLDFTGVSAAVTTELSPAITAAMPIAGVILAAGIGWKLYKRFTR